MAFVRVDHRGRHARLRAGVATVSPGDADNIDIAGTDAFAVRRLTAPDVFEVAVRGPELGEPCVTLRR